MSIPQFITIFLTAVITAGASNLFGYWKEKGISNSKYTERVLTNLYIPIYKILSKDLHTQVGYTGITIEETLEIKKIVDENPELCDPKLEGIIRIHSGGVGQFLSQNYTDADYEMIKLDEDKELFNHVNKSFNITRKSLGLPYSGKRDYLISSIKEYVNKKRYS